MQTLRVNTIDVQIRKWYLALASVEIAARREVDAGRATLGDVADLLRADTGKDMVDAARALM